MVQGLQTLPPSHDSQPASLYSGDEQMGSATSTQRSRRKAKMGQTQLGQSNFEQREKFAVRAREQLDIGVKT